METTIETAEARKSVNPVQPQQSKIIIRRIFGDQNFIDLYADYVAEKIMEEMRKAKEPSNFPS